MGIDEFSSEQRAPIWIENVDCAGAEIRIIDCMIPYLGTTCSSHIDDAGVLCDGVCKYKV